MYWRRNRAKGEEVMGEKHEQVNVRKEEGREGGINIPWRDSTYKFFFLLFCINSRVPSLVSPPPPSSCLDSSNLPYLTMLEFQRAQMILKEKCLP